MSGFVSGVGQAAFNLAYVICPIFLINGVATNIDGAALPIAYITEASDLVLGLLSGSIPTSLDQLFAHWAPLPGATWADNQIAQYPFANQSVAANALIAQPNYLSMLMICPVQDNWLAALGTMTLLKSILDQHDALGGTYTILTPKRIYTNGVRLGMKDVSTAESKQPQNTFQIDFLFPLLTLEQAQAAQNNLMSKLTNGTQIIGDPTYATGPSAAASILGA